MLIPFGVIAVYGALVVWTGLLLAGLKRGAFGAFLVFGIALLVVLNARYAIERAPELDRLFHRNLRRPGQFWRFRSFKRRGARHVPEQSVHSLG